MKVTSATTSPDDEPRLAAYVSLGKRIPLRTSHRRDRLPAHGRHPPLQMPSVPAPSLPLRERSPEPVRVARIVARGGLLPQDPDPECTSID
ncbi:hypothetical protein [Methanogenium cariaci]|uniref:hypothetical protein n=1 Tax=Methanogenium cariaci TaxID=2197 RepID=UPI001FE23124|nr:hypothetical protein [Methanogenium cariaci]